MRHVLFAFFIALLAAVPAAAAEFMPADSLHRGMRGIGKTVFRGAAIDTFQVEILGVVDQALGPGKDLILARLSGSSLEQTGVIAGMSGSPVYVQGRLVGAVAYSWPFARVPICGITPIGDMLQVMERDMAAPADAGRVWAPAPAGRAIPADVPASIEAPGLPGAIALRALQTPVAVAGFTPAAQRILDELLHPLGLQVMAAPAGRAAAAEAPAVFEPGAALGVQLIRGDMNATGIGTLSYVDGERIVGFGHPMFLSGATDLPMTAAYIYDIIPSRIISFKIGAATRALGAIRQDRSPAIAGLIGPVPEMLPVEVELRSRAGERRVHCEVLRQRELTPVLARAVLLGALEAAEKLSGDATLQLHSTLRLSDGQRVEREQVYSGPGSILQAGLEAAEPLSALLHSPFERAYPLALRFEVELSEEIEAARVRALRVDNKAPRPGDSLVVHIALQPYGGAVEERRVEIALPAHLEPGPLTLRVGSGAASRAWESQRRPDTFEAHSAEHLLELLNYPARNDELVVELYRLEEGFSVEGREFPGLPPSARAILAQEGSAGRLGPVHGRVVQLRRLRTQYVLSGEQSLELNIRER